MSSLHYENCKLCQRGKRHKHCPLCLDRKSITSAETRPMAYYRGFCNKHDEQVTEKEQNGSRSDGSNDAAFAVTDFQQSWRARHGLRKDSLIEFSMPEAVRPDSTENAPINIPPSPEDK